MNDLTDRVEQIRRSRPPRESWCPNRCEQGWWYDQAGRRHACRVCPQTLEPLPYRQTADTADDDETPTVAQRAAEAERRRKDLA